MAIAAARVLGNLPEQDQALSSPHGAVHALVRSKWHACAAPCHCVPGYCVRVLVAPLWHPCGTQQVDLLASPVPAVRRLTAPYAVAASPAPQWDLSMASMEHVCV